MSTTELMAIDTDGLLEVAKVTREAPPEEFKMDQLCGTACCAIGNFLRKHPEDVLATTIRRKNKEFEAVAERFGISPIAAMFLFSPTYYADCADVSQEVVANRIADYVTWPRY